MATAGPAPGGGGRMNGVRGTVRGSKRRWMADPTGEGRAAFGGAQPGLAPPLQLSVLLPQGHLTTESCGPWRRRVTLTPPPRRPAPPLPCWGCWRRAGGLGVGRWEGKDAQDTARTRDQGCHRNLWGSAPRREGAGVVWKGAGRGAGSRVRAGGLRRSRRPGGGEGGAQEVTCAGPKDGWSLSSWRGLTQCLPAPQARPLQRPRG